MEQVRDISSPAIWATKWRRSHGRQKCRKWVDQKDQLPDIFKEVSNIVAEMGRNLCRPNGW